MKKTYCLTMLLALFMGCITLTGCSSDDAPFTTADENDYPRILDPYFPDWSNGRPGEFKNFSRDLNLEATAIVTPAQFTTVKWYIDGEQVADGLSINQPLLAGEYLLKVVATTTMGKETSRTSLVVVRPCDGDPVPGNDIRDRQVVPGSTVKLHGSNMDNVSKIVIDGRDVNVTFVENGDKSYVEYTVPADLSLGGYRIRLVDAEGNVYGGGMLTVSSEAPVVTEETIWEGHAVIDWNAEICKLTPEQFANVSVGQSIKIYYELLDAEYYNLRIITPYWNDVPGGTQIDITTDTPNPYVLEYTADFKALVESEGGMSCVGFGYAVTKITVE